MRMSRRRTGSVHSASSVCVRSWGRPSWATLRTSVHLSIRITQWSSQELTKAAEAHHQDLEASQEVRINQSRSRERSFLAPQCCAGAPASPPLLVSRLCAPECVETCVSTPGKWQDAVSPYRTVAPDDRCLESALRQRSSRKKWRPAKISRAPAVERDTAGGARGG